eukprot:COSAG06_NODE_4944_length_3842_cov_1.486775_1_plen_214_part_00
MRFAWRPLLKRRQSLRHTTLRWRSRGRFRTWTSISATRRRRGESDTAACIGARPTCEGQRGWLRVCCAVFQCDFIQCLAAAALRLYCYSGSGSGSEPPPGAGPYTASTAAPASTTAAAAKNSAIRSDPRISLNRKIPSSPDTTRAVWRIGWATANDTSCKHALCHRDVILSQFSSRQVFLAARLPTVAHAHLHFIYNALWWRVCVMLSRTSLA